MRVYQCCYTNATTTVGGVTKAGWQPVAVSDGMPTEVYNKCVSLQTVNSAIQGAMLDENNNTLNLFEIVGDQDYVYVLRTKYGLLDRIGRANMFSHAFVMPWDDETFNNPGYYLDISDDCFRDNEEEAAAQCANLENALSWSKSSSLDEAFSRSKMTEESLLTLVRCVALRLTDKTYSEPLYIQYDGSIQYLRDVAYCIYMNLPFYLRKRLSIASSPSTSTKTKTLVFSIHASEKRLYVDPKTGMNSILNDRLIRKLQRLEYLDYVPSHYGDISPNTYFASLSHKAEELGDATASSPRILKITHRQVTNFNYGKLDDVSLKEEISDTILSVSGASEEMEKLLASLLNLACDRSIALSEMAESDLSRQLSDAQTKEFKDAGDRYLIYRFSQIPEEDAIKRLVVMDEALRPTYIKWLQETPRGLSILDGYHAVLVSSMKPVSWEKLHQCIEDSAYLLERPKTIDEIDRAAAKLYSSSLTNIKSGYENYKVYVELMNEIMPSDIELCKQVAKEAYWEHVTISNFSYDQRDDYSRMAIDGTKPKAAIVLAKIVSYLEIPDEEQFLVKGRKYLQVYPNELGKSEDVIQYLFREIRERYQGNDNHLGWWLRTISGELLDDTIGILLGERRALISNDINSFFQSLGAILEMRLPAHIGTAVDSDVVKKFLPQIEHADARTPFSLDEWLLAGDALGKNPFTIFDNSKPAILSMDPANVVAGSVLVEGVLSSDPKVSSNARRYLNQADEYVRMHGLASKTVKKWLQEAKKQTSSRREPNSSGGGLFSRFVKKEEETPQNQFGFQSPRKASHFDDGRRDKKTNSGWGW